METVPEDHNSTAMRPQEARRADPRTRRAPPGVSHTMHGAVAGVLDSLLDRTIVFSFDRTGYRRHAAGFVPGDLDVDLSGKVAIVTGANAGLGYEIALGLARLGATVRLVCRHAARGEAALQRLADEARHPHLRLDVVDVSSLAAVRAYVASLDAAQVDVLVNNAGVLLDELSFTEEGLERTLATNLVGPFLLTELLLPKLARSADARVVQVSSGGMYSERLDVAALESAGVRRFDAVAAYARTKRAQVVLNELWAERHAAFPITWSAMHPGWADTPGVRTSLPRFRLVTQHILRTPAEGADTAVWLSACRRLRGESGYFWFDRTRQPTHLWSRTREPAEEREVFWRALERWANLA